MTIVPVGDFCPDIPAYLGQHATVATNIYPRSDGSDGPLREPITMSIPANAGGVGTDVMGAVAMRDSTGAIYLMAGTNDDLLLQNGLTWTGKGSATYSATRAHPWRFAQFGDYAIAACRGDPPQNWLLGDGADFVDLTGAPNAAFVATFEPGFLMLANIDDGMVKASSLRWSAINDHTDWPTIGTTDAAAKQSDEQQLPNGGAITGLAGAVGGAAGAVWTEKAVYRVEYIGAPAIFAFREIVRGSGCMCPNATIVLGGVAYYISEEGFQAFDGQAERAIGFGRVSRTFLNSVNMGALDRVCVTADPLRKIIVWAYPDAAAPDGHPNRWLIYNYASDRWRYSDDPSVRVEFLFPSRSVAYTLDTLDTVLPAGADGYDISVDSPLYAGGIRLLAGFNTSHQLQSFEGATLAALVETGETDAKGMRAFATGIRPLTDAPNATAAVGYRDTFSGQVQYGPLTPMEVTGICPQRVNSRYMRARIYIPAGDAWSYIQGADVMMKSGGGR